jgi:DNA polymerase elongation subunit (family B)
MVTKRQKWFNKPSDDVVAGFKALHPMGWVSEEELKAKKKGEKQYSYWKNWKVATNLNVVIGGFRFDFGTGGIHGSVSNRKVVSDDKYMIVDADVASMYPNIAIANRVFPEHLSEKFCDIYQDVYNQRKSYPKGSAENAMLKLALNGVYGDSNNKYSPFYDPQYTMTITINGQLSLCLLADKLMDIDDLEIIQVNTDGITVRMPRDKHDEYITICDAWQRQVGLQLEYAEYSKMFIKDCNNYIAVYE